MKMKKGFVVGTALLTVVVILAVVFLMALLILIASGAYLTKAPKTPKAELSSSAESSIFQPVEISPNGIQTKKVLILDAIVEGTLAEKRFQEIQYQLQHLTTETEKEQKDLIAERNSLTNYPSQIKQSIGKALEKQTTEKTCFLVFQGPGKALSDSSNTIQLEGNGKDISFVIENSKASEVLDRIRIEKYQENNMLVSLPQFTAEKFGVSQTFSIEYYYGPCQNVQ
jgi:hypothetical protein